MTTSFDVIVVGSGAAGLFTALELSRTRRVLVVTKGAIDDANTSWAQGGIAAALRPPDSPAQHLADTIAAGAGLVDEAAARILCDEAPAAIAALLAAGTPFDRAPGGDVALGREAAHSHGRVLHAGGDRSGAVIEQTLAGLARERVTIHEHTPATRILVEGGCVHGVEAAAPGGARALLAPAVVIATGGAGQLFSHTTNPEIATGDGIALAFAAGAEVADLEFMQFHPTALRLPGMRPFLISETVRGEGALLRNPSGEAFMARYHPMADLAPRDVVARAIVREMRAAAADHVLLDCTHLEPSLDLAARFPGIFSFCLEAGLDIRTTPIPVAPAAHYLMGGIRTDTFGRTTVPGLYAAGEAACTGVHGANRLASNSLMETIVFGKRVAAHVASGEGGSATLSPGATGAAVTAASIAFADLQALMWRDAGIERNADGLAAALAQLSEPTGAGSPAAVVARLMVQAALARTESRGAHFRTDFPLRDDARWLRRQVFRRAD